MNGVKESSAGRSEARVHAAMRVKRVRQGVLGICIALVSLFALATASYVRPYGIMSVGTKRWWAVGFVRGDLMHLRGDSGGVLPQGMRWRADTAWPKTARGANGLRVKVPYALFAGLMGLAGAGFASQASVAGMRARRGLCRVCEYDLRGLDVVEGYKTCPECGTRKRAVVRAR